MNYCHVVDGVIKEGPRGLPKSWKNVSGLNLSTATELKSLGWLPVDHIQIEPTSNQVRNGRTTEVMITKVKITDLVRDMTEQEIIERTASILRGIRQERDVKIADCDWTILPDSPLSESVKYDWTTYRQELRDFPSVVDTAFVVWPTKPEL